MIMKSLLTIYLNITISLGLQIYQGIVQLSEGNSL